jgi:metallo-beta-lactamase family protein
MNRLTFCGAAGTVTGSATLIESFGRRLLVDCGLFQGNKTVRELNYGRFPFDPKELDLLILTHAHVDHAGLVPKLVAQGFGGPIVCTPATADLLEVMLPDGASIQLSNAERENRKRQRRGQPERRPLFTPDDAQAALRQVQTLDYEQWQRGGLEREWGFRFWNAGHILGSASVEFDLPAVEEAHRLRLLFSGDLGPEEKAFHPEPDAPEGYDYLVCESTYGDRERDDYTLEGRREALRQELIEGLSRGGNVIVPSFAVERSQELLLDIANLLTARSIPDATVYLDSPLATKVTQTFLRHARGLEDMGQAGRELLRHPNFKLIQSVDESKALNRIHGGAIVISASGMCDAGRIQHHLKNNLWRDEATVLFVGYQAPGTLGQLISSGVRDVRIHGREYRVRARVRRIGNYSAHADRSELADWILERQPVQGGVFLNHGEDDGRRGLRDLLVSRGFPQEKVYLPRFDERFELRAGAPESKGRAAERLQPQAAVQDWSHDLAAFQVELQEALEAAGEADERQALIARLAAALAE